MDTPPLRRVARTKELRATTLAAQPETTTVRRKSTEHAVELAVTTHTSAPCFCPQADFLKGGRLDLVDGNMQFSFSDLVAVTHDLSPQTHGRVPRFCRPHLCRNHLISFLIVPLLKIRWFGGISITLLLLRLILKEKCWPDLPPGNLTSHLRRLPPTIRRALQPTSPPTPGSGTT